MTATSWRGKVLVSTGFLTIALANVLGANQRDLASVRDLVAKAQKVSAYSFESKSQTNGGEPVRSKNWVKGKFRRSEINSPALGKMVTIWRGQDFYRQDGSGRFQKEDFG